MSSNIVIHRLLPDTPGAWTHYEVFEGRVRAFLAKHLPETNAVRAIQDLRVRWINAPITTGYFIGHHDGGQCFGHFVSYVADHYGEPFVLFNQIELDPTSQGLQVIREVGAQLRVWIANYNKVLESAKRPERITYCESWTWIEPEVYLRLFRAAGFEIHGERHVFRWSLKE